MNDTHFAAKDFSKKVVSALSRKGIQIIGITWLPNANGDTLNGERGYELDDNGCFKIRVYREVRELGDDPVSW